MTIGFDASRAFIAEATGTENYSLNLLKALAKIDRKNLYRVYLRQLGYWAGRSLGKKSQQPNYLKTQLPSNFKFVQIRPSHLWTQVGLARETWLNPVDILFVPAHTLPILRRKIMPSSVSSRGAEGPVAILRDCFSASWRIAMTSKRRMKTIVTIHDLGVEFLPGYHQFPQRYYLDLASKYAASAADALIAVSAATKHDLVKKYRVNAKKIQVVAEGVDTSFFKPASKKEIQNVKIKYQIEGNYILFVGTVQPRKNLQILIKAFAEAIRRLGDQAIGRSLTSPNSLKARMPQSLSLVIAGKLGWDYQKILDLPKKLAVESRVKFLEYVNRQDLPSLYTGSAVFALPSLFEGFGLPILEALACSCPVVASDIEPHREIFEKLGFIRGPVATPSLLSRQTMNYTLKTIPEAVILVKPNDLGKWTDVLYQYISLYNNRLSFISKKRNLRQVRQTLASIYSWEETAKKTLRVFQEVLR